MSKENKQEKPGNPVKRARKKTSGNRPRGALQDEVLAILRQGLMLGSFAPGQLISLRKLADTLGTSSMPVRDALAQLTAAGVLETTPSRTVCVPRLNKKRLTELTEVRIAIEGMATKAAFANATPGLRKKLHAINRRLLKAIEQRGIVNCLSVNREFHFTLYEAAESEILMPIIEGLWLQCGPTMYHSLLHPGMTWNSSSHVEILEGLDEGDEAKTLRGITKDIRTALKTILTSPAVKQSDGPLVSPMSYFDIGLR